MKVSHSAELGAGDRALDREDRLRVSGPPLGTYVSTPGSATTDRECAPCTSGIDSGIGISLDANGNIYIAGSKKGALSGRTSAGADDAVVRRIVPGA